MLIRSTIVNLMVEIAHEHDKKLAPINNDLALHESLDSIHWLLPFWSRASKISWTRIRLPTLPTLRFR